MPVNALNDQPANLYATHPKFKKTNAMSVKKVNFIPSTRLLKSGGGVLMPFACIKRPIMMAKESWIKIIVSKEAMIEVTNNIDYSLDNF